MEDRKRELEQAIADFLAVCKVNAKALPAMRRMLEASREVGIAMARASKLDPAALGLRAVKGEGISVDDVFGGDS